MNILGINAYHGNASAALVCDGKLVAAVEEERFNRVKYAAGFPAPRSLIARMMPASRWPTLVLDLASRDWF
jgi:predicted NodU family carbamoyl transferase